MTEPADDQQRTRQVIAAVQPITDKVQGIVGRVKTLGWVYIAGAAGLAGALFSWVSVETSGWFYAAAALVFLLLSLPSGILFLFHGALQTVIALPRRLLEKAGVGEASARNVLGAIKASSVDAPVQKTKILRTLSELRGLVLDSKDMLLEYSVLLRLANPFVLGIVAFATVAGFGIVLAAVIALIIVLL